MDVVVFRLAVDLSFAPSRCGVVPIIFLYRTVGTIPLWYRTISYLYIVPLAPYHIPYRWHHPVVVSRHIILLYRTVSK